MNTLYAATNNVRRYELRQTFEPKTRGFGLPVAELPRLNDLIRLAPPCAKNTDWVFNSNLRNVYRGQSLDEGNCLILLSLPTLEPPRASYSQPRAWRVEDG